MSTATQRHAPRDDSPFLAGGGEHTSEQERHARPASRAGGSSRRPAACFPPRLEISPLTIRPAIPPPGVRLPIC